MNPSSHDKSLVDPHIPRPPHFELSPLDSRRPVPEPHNQAYRDPSFDQSQQHTYRSHPRSAANHPPLHQAQSAHPSALMKTSIMHQQQPSMPPASLQGYPSSSTPFTSIQDSQHSTNSSFAQPGPPPHHHIPGAGQLHQQASQQAPVLHHSHPPRPDLQKMAYPSHQSMRRYPPQQRQHQHLASGKPADHVQNVTQASALPQMSKVQSSSLHILPQHQVPSRYQQVSSHMQQSRGGKNDAIPSMPLPMHPDPVQQYQQDVNEGERGFSFSRGEFFGDLGQDADQNPVGLPPPHPLAQEPEQGNTLAGVDSLTGGLGMPGVAAISNLPLPGIAGGQNAALHGVGGFGAPTSMGNAAITGGASEIAEALEADRKLPPHQRRIRTSPRVRSQQMTESQRKQRHNEHTRASRSRIDKGLERLKKTIRKIRPHQKVSKKADVLQEAVKLLKEGFRLPATESDDERDDARESSLST